jgi:DNA-binding MarR family transcriptional regulator
MLKPQEIFILVVLASREDSEWTYAELAAELDMSQSQVFKSLERAEVADLFVKSKRRVIRRNLLEFLIHGVRYAFAVEAGRMTRGIPAGWQIPGLSELMLEDSSETYVWPNPMGSIRGQAVEPLHQSLPTVASRDPELHVRFALIDIIRVGSARERKVATDELEKRLG